MKPLNSVLVCCLLPIAAVSLHAQNVVLGRVVGQNTLIMKSSAPNLVEGREMTNPQGVALDTSTSTPAIYVSDTGNNRVLVWKNAASFQNGAFADLVIGQKDVISTSQNGPGTNFTKGLNAPTGLVVDGQGNLYVLDSGNNRILRYPKPLVQPDPFKADQVIGQTDFTTNGNNKGGLSESSLSFTTYAGPLRGGLALDKQGNLWVTDAGNHRVLRFPADPANAGKVLATANLVLGQNAFTTNTPANTANSKNQMNTPSGIAIDQAGNVFVADAAHRVLVFSPLPAFSTGQNAINFIGEILNQQGHAVNPPTRQTLNTPASVTIVPGTNEVLVSDTFNNRVLKFPTLAMWPSSGQPSANLVIGQPSDTANKAGVGASLLSAPVDVAASGTEIFVADSRNNRVVVFPNGGTAAVRVLGQLGMDYNAPNLIEGRELYLVGFLPKGGGNFLTIGGGLAIDTTGAVPHLFITDPGNNRVLGYCDARKAKQGDKADLVIGQPDLYHSMANGDGGTTPNNQYLWLPSGITVDPAGSLYIADTGNGRVLRFAAPCSQPVGQQSFPQANLVIGQADFVSHTTDPSASTMRAPFGVALTPEGYLLVSDVLQNRVLRFEKPQGGDFSNGQAATAVLGQPDPYTTSANNGDNQMDSPRHLAVDSRGRLYVADFNNNRILIFSDAAHTLSGATAATTLYTEENNNRYLNRPEGIAVNPATGEIWVAPANETRILRYPEYNTLSIAPYATAQALTATGPLGVALDSQGDVFVAESGNRVSEYFPEVDPVNGASFVTGRELAPGVIASVWAKRGSTPATNAKSVPLPTDMAGMQVLVGGTPAPLFYAGDSAYPGYVQINFQVPNNAPSSGFIDTQVLDSATQQVLGAGILPMKAAAPALFVANAGTGQVAALNYDPNAKQYSCNGVSAPASSGCPNGTRPVNRGEVLILYLTGQGYQSGWTKDGDAPTGAVNTDGEKPLVLIGQTQFVPNDYVEYSGAAPGFVGLWQINVKVPNNNSVVPGAANPVAVLYRDVPSSINGTPKTVIQVQ